MARLFEDKFAVRERVPLLVALFGPSGSGKTFSALRLAQGIQAVSGGDVFVIDTEGRRALSYADRFKFRHIDFREPFGSLDYLEALRHCARKGAGVIVVDSMSHEHEGVGGYLRTQEAEIDRLAGDDLAKRERVKITAWAKPSAKRRELINGMLQLGTNFVFCFRAKDKIKPKPGSQPIELGFVPVGGDDFLFEMTAAALLMPGALGAPTWKPDKVGEKGMVKLPEQFRSILERTRQLDEASGRAMAEWAQGGAPPAPAKETAAPAVDVPHLLAMGEEAAERGAEVLKGWWTSRTKAERAAVADRLGGWKRQAAEVDARDRERAA